MVKRFAASLVFVTVVFSLRAQLVIDETMTPAQLVQNVLLGGGVTVSNVRYNGVLNPATPQVGSGSFIGTASNLGLAAGIILSTGEVADAADAVTGFASSTNGTNADADLALLSGQTINDRGVLEFDFIPTGDSLKFRYIFASEEYPEYACSNFNDAFGFFLSGPGIVGPYQNGAINIALVPGTTVPIAINTVNAGVEGTNGDPLNCAAADPNWQSNSVYYIDNQGLGGTTVVYDGFTVVLTAFALVECGVQYHIKLAIGDGFDSSFDSAVFLEAGSFTSTGQVVPTLANNIGVSGNTMLEGCGLVDLVFTRLGDTTVVDTVNMVITGTATAGIDYAPPIPAQMIFPVGVDTIIVSVNVPFDADGPETIIITVDQLIECSGQTVQTIFTFNIDSPPPLDVQTVDLNSSCGLSQVLTPVVTGGMGVYHYVWSTGDITPSATVSPGVTTTYTVTVSDTCAVVPVSADFTVTLPIYPPLDIEVSPPTAIDCLDTAPIAVTSATGGNNVFAYAWTLQGVPLGNTATIIVPAGPPLWFVATVTEGCGTSIADSVLVTTVPLPPIEITTAGDPTVLCAGDSAVMEIVGIVGGNGVYTLEWHDASGTQVGGAYDLQVAVPVDHTYTIEVEDQCGTIGTAQITTFIPVYPPFILTLPEDKVLCAGDSTDIHALVTGGSGYYHILWNGPDSLTDPLYRVAPQSNTTYHVRVTDRCGEQRTGAMRVDVEHVFTSIQVTNTGEDDWYLQAATIPYARSWVWDMGDGTRYRHDEVRHSYLNLEEHWATLKIITNNGCHGADSVLLRPPAHIFFPNAFTPNGDGLNDFFGPVGHSIESFEMTVFDRWGEVVFTTEDPNIQWDGSINGSGAPQTGVYVFTYRAEGHYFPPEDGIGHVTLLSGSANR